MQHSKLVALLKTCNRKELRKLDKFVDSPYFNTNRNIVALYRYVQQFAPKFESKQLERKAVFSALFPNEAYKEKRLHKLMGELLKLIDHFFHLEEWQQNETTQHISALAAYQKRNLNAFWEQKLEKTSLLLEKMPLQAEASFYQSWQLALEKHKAVEAEEQRNKEPLLQAVHTELDAFYLCNKLKYYCKVLNYQRFQAHKYDIYMMESVLQTATLPIYRKNPAIQIYYFGVLSLQKPDDIQHFLTLKSLLQQHLNHFSLEETQNILVLARNFCIKQLNQGKAKYINELLDVYKLEIEHKILLVDGKVPASTCRNIVAVAMLAEELEWTAEFLLDYQKYLDKTTFAFNLATVRFHQAEYESVLPLLAATKYKDVLLRLGVKALQLKTFYELYMKHEINFQYEDELDLYLQSFSAFLRRNSKILTKNVVYYENLIAFVKQIFAIKQDVEADKMAWKDFYETVEKCVEVAEKAWLVEKIDLLIFNHK